VLLFVFYGMLSPVHTVAESEFGDSLTFLRQCGQGFSYLGPCVRSVLFCYSVDLHVLLVGLEQLAVARN